MHAYSPRRAQTATLFLMLSLTSMTLAQGSSGGAAPPVANPPLVGAAPPGGAAAGPSGTAGAPANTAPAPAGGASAPMATGFLFKTLALDGKSFPYCVYVPPEYTPTQAWPVILFLHGSGECGADGFRQTDVGIGHAIRGNRWRVPAVVVMPQLPVENRNTTGWTGPMGLMAIKCVEQTSSEYRLDVDRVYLTGISLGGHGTFHVAAAMPGTFAALAPICGFAELGQSTGVAEKIATRLTRTPTWCFHGDMDDRVPVQKAREVISAIRAAGGKPYYTEVRGGNHFIWDRVYDDNDFWKWLFQQKRGGAAPAAPETVMGGASTNTPTAAPPPQPPPAPARP